MKLLLLFLSIVFSVPLQAKPELFGEQLARLVEHSILEQRLASAVLASAIFTKRKH